MAKEEQPAGPPQTPVTIELKPIRPLQEIERRFIVATPVEALKKSRRTGVEWLERVQEIDQGYIDGARLELRENTLLIYDKKKTDETAHVLAQCNLNKKHVEEIQAIIDGVGKMPHANDHDDEGGKRPESKKPLGRLRVRIVADDKKHKEAFFTFKTPRKLQGEARSRKEFEYCVLPDNTKHAEMLYKTCEEKIVKVRHTFYYHGHKWELDKYAHPALAYELGTRGADGDFHSMHLTHPLQIAEIELKKRHVSLPFEDYPSFIHPKNEVTNIVTKNNRSLYSNHHLATLITEIPPDTSYKKGKKTETVHERDLRHIRENGMEALKNEREPRSDWRKWANRDRGQGAGASLTR